MNKKSKNNCMLKPLAKNRLFCLLLILVFNLKCSGLSEPDLGFREKRIFNDHKEVDVFYKSSDGTILGGTLFLPLTARPHPSIVFSFGSGPWTRVEYSTSGVPRWIDEGIAVLSYDKRGVGQSGGECCPVDFPLLANDIIAGIRVLQTRDDIDSKKIGIWGFSQGGWVVPIVAARLEEEVAFTIIGSGPTVTVGEESLYSRLTGDDNNCTPSGIPQSEIDSILERAGPSGFDPVPDIKKMSNPGLWLYGRNDTSVPVKQSVAIIENIRDSLNKDLTAIVFPNANHCLIEGGAMCQTEGAFVDALTPTFAWLSGVLAK